MRDRLVGILFFLPVPVVLVLLTQAPIGVSASLGCAIALILSHRLYARPYALRGAARRCLWCGATARGQATIRLAEPLGTGDWRACEGTHSASLRSTFGYARDHGLALRLLILGSLLTLLVVSLSVAFGFLADERHADAVNVFRLAVAGAVLPLGWLGPRSAQPDTDPIAIPFPVHVQALIGTWSVLWLFRLVGLLWLALALRHFGRLAGS